MRRAKSYSIVQAKSLSIKVHVNYLYWKFRTMPNYFENSKMLAFEKAWVLP